MVAVNERYGEAQVIRKELKNLEVNEQNRVENLLLKEFEKKRKALSKKHEREEEFLVVKNREAYDALVVQKELERGLLDKKIRLSLNDIRKSQKLMSSVAEKLAKTRDELRRTKSKSKKVQEYLSEAKTLKSQRKTFDSLPFLSQSIHYTEKKSAPSQFSSSQGYKSVAPLKHSLSNITKFKITPEALSKDVPINLCPNPSLSSHPLQASNKPPHAYSRPSKSLHSLTSLYDTNLNLIRNNPTNK